jgi:hypothetical protein
MLDLVDPTAGFDLDHVNTVDPATGGCTFPDGGDPSSFVDQPSGVDNAMAGFSGAMAALGMSLSNVNARLVGGAYGMLVAITDWNETPTDDIVTVDLFPTLGIWSVTGDSQATTVPGGPSNPNHLTIVGGGDASDLWMRDRRFPVGQTAVQAWVDNGQLVARWDTLVLPIRLNSDPKLIDLTFHDAWMTASLAPGQGGARATLHNGVLGGRLSVPEFLDQLRVHYAGGGYLCLVQGFAASALDALCNARDIRSSHCEDRRGLPCDAVSGGVRFDTYALDNLGPPPYDQEDAGVYEDAGLLRPAERCLDADDRDSAITCP